MFCLQSSLADRDELLADGCNHVTVRVQYISDFSGGKCALVEVFIIRLHG